MLSVAFSHRSFVVVVSPTISLINSQIEGLKSLGIDAFSLGRAAGIESHLNHERIFSADGKRSFPSVVFMTQSISSIAFSTIWSKIRIISN